MYTDYAYIFILASFILLAAMLGAIILTFSVRNEIKRQEGVIQIRSKGLPTPGPITQIDIFRN